jgi:hypothetical protein
MAKNVHPNIGCKRNIFRPILPNNQSLLVHAST